MKKGEDEKSKELIPVVFATDDNYVPYCGVAISSLIQNGCRENVYEIFILYDRLSQTNLLRLENLSTDYAKVRCVCIHDYVVNLKVLEHNHLTIASAYRLVIPEVFPQYEKVIYLDSDIVVNADVAELYHIDIGDCILGAAHGYYENDFHCEENIYITHTLQIDEKNFFNAGILLFNISEFRKRKITERCFILLSQRTDLLYMDQCALNILCEGNIFFLPLKWNYEWLFLFYGDNQELYYREKPLNIMKDPAIIHYDGVEKPWNYPDQMLSDYFWQYARQTVFYEEILQRMQTDSAKTVCGVFAEMLGCIGKFRDIAIYGAGHAGKRYVDKILSWNIGNIVIWVDQNFKDKKCMKRPGESVEKLYTTKFDYVLIAIESPVISAEVRELLISRGIPEAKIVQI